MKIQCQNCQTEIECKKSEKQNLYYFHCATCQIGGKAETKEKAKENFLADAELKKVGSTAIATLPTKKNLMEWVQNNISALMSHSAQFVDKPQTRLMIEKNVRYIAGADLKDAWNTPEGQSSIVEALEEALYIGATMPEMGCVVPFKYSKGYIVEFIPAVSAFQFALTEGKKAPFKKIIIDCLYKNDIYEMSRTDGNFHFSITKMAIPRGDILGIVVQAIDHDDKIIGEAYDETRLIKKAEQSSRSYQYYLNDLHELKKAQAEGKDFIIKFDKKLYEKDITNPYANADKPEMLKKLAGKSFLWPFMKIRNAVAMADEWRDISPEENYDMAVKRTVDDSIEALKKDIENIQYKIENYDDEDDPYGIGEGIAEVRLNKKKEELKKMEEKKENGKLFEEEGL